MSTIKVQIQKLEAGCKNQPTSYCKKQISLLQQALSAGNDEKALEKLLTQYAENEKNRPHLIISDELKNKIKARRVWGVS